MHQRKSVHLLPVWVFILPEYPPLQNNDNLSHRNISGTETYTEIGVQRIGIIQSLLTTCQLQDVDPYTYLVDVLQRIGQHPAQRVIELTPRVWKTQFADQPLRFDLYRALEPPYP